MRVLRKVGLVSDSSTKALDELEKKLEDACSNDEDEDAKVLDADNEEEVTVDPDTMKDGAAQLRKFIKDMKPIIASIPNAATRRRLTDSIVKMSGLVTSGDGQYAGVLDTAKKAAADAAMKKKQIASDADADFGMDVAQRWNPHYKKEG